MKKCIGELMEQLYGLIGIFFVIIICFFASKSFFVEYGDLIFYGGISLTVGGFLYSTLKSDKLSFGKTIIIGGIITMFLGYII